MKLHTVVLALGLVLCACPAKPSADAGTSDPGGGGGGGSSGTGGGSGGGGGTVVTSDGGAASAPQLTEVVARQSGRAGKDLSLSVKGKDRNLDALTVRVRLLDAQDSAVSGLDQNHDGKGDASEGVLALDGKKWSGEAVTATATARGAQGNAPTLAKVGVKLVDATSLESEEQVVSVTAQPVLASGESCDTTFVLSRCNTGLGCRGSPATCQEGLAPEITKMAFLKNGTGAPSILLEGTEPEDDLSTIRFTFLDGGQAIDIDSDGDGTPDMSAFEHDATGLAVDGTFFLRLEAAVGLDTQVPKLVATPKDGADHTGAQKTAAPTNITVRSSGQTCDPHGFDTCGSGLTCSPGTVGVTNTCKSSSPLRTAECSAATLLTPTSSGAKVVGVAEGGSLWDTPAGCSSNDPKGRPEGVVTMRLLNRADKVTLSTVSSGTTFDTALYVMSACPDSSQDNLGCSDDAPGGNGASTVVLTDLPAGDYLVVIDSFDTVGGTFELTATVE